MKPRTRIPFDRMMKVHRGPMAVVRTCLECGEVVHRRQLGAGAGRGTGMREGNKGNGQMVKHWKERHAGLYTQFLKESFS